jgi:hypothetical protein
MSTVATVIRCTRDLKMFKNHCQFNLKTTKMALGETKKVDFEQHGLRPY